MLNKKLTDKSLMGALLLLGVVIILVVYFIPVKNITDDNDRLKLENSGLKSTIESLKSYYENREYYTSQTEELKKEIQVTIARFPSLYREEDYIMQAVALERVSEHLVYNVIDIKSAETLAYVDQKTVESVGIEGLNQPIEFLVQSVNYTNKTEYMSLKQALAEAFKSTYKLNIQRITYNANEKDSTIEGSIVLGYYYITGNGVPYVEPSIPEYMTGNDNIFGSYLKDERARREETEEDKAEENQ